MSMNKINDLRLPQINQLPSDKKVDEANLKKSQEKSEFDKLLGNVEDKSKEVTMSSHAMKRLEERNIEFDGNEYLKLKDAMAKLKTKGGHDSLVITPKAAYVLDVDKGMVVTAVDRDNMNENVFTKIDSTIFMN